MLDNELGAVHQWVDIEHVSRNMLLVTMGQEDQALPDRAGAFDLDEFLERVQAHQRGEPDASGSTIPQQLVKNLILTPDQNAFRKGIEALVATELAWVVPDARVLELYVNYAQFGPRVYGVCAASWYYFGHSSRSLTKDESAQLVGLLPSPLHVRRGLDGGLWFDDDDRDGDLDELDSGSISAEPVWRAQREAARWIQDMGGYGTTERMGIPGLASDQPIAEDPCREPSAEVAALMAAGQN